MVCYRSLCRNNKRSKNAKFASRSLRNEWDDYLQGQIDALIMLEQDEEEDVYLPQEQKEYMAQQVDMTDFSLQEAQAEKFLDDIDFSICEEKTIPQRRRLPVFIELEQRETVMERNILRFMANIDAIFDSNEMLEEESVTMFLRYLEAEDY